MIALLLATALAADVTVEGPEPVAVRIDGKDAGVTPLRLQLDPGKHQIHFRAPDSEDDVFGLAIEVTEGPRTIAVTADLVAKLAEQTVRPWPKLRVTSEVEGAAIHLDGTDTGKTTPATLELPGGTHALTVQSECLSGRVEVDLADGGLMQRHVPLDERPSLVVRSTPGAATVRVDGHTVGQTNGTWPVGCGQHVVDVRLPGHLPFRRTVDAAKPVEVTLQPGEVGGLEVITDQPDAALFVDGMAFGTGTTLIEALAYGPHTVKAGPVERSVEIGPEPTTVSLVIPPEAPEPTPPAAAPPPAEPEPAVVAKKARRPLIGKGGPRRLGVNTTVSVAALTAGTLATYHYIRASQAYRTYKTFPDNAVAERIYTTDVQPRTRSAHIEMAIAGVLAAGGATLWLTTEF